MGTLVRIVGARPVGLYQQVESGARGAREQLGECQIRRIENESEQHSYMCMLSSRYR